MAKEHTHVVMLRGIRIFVNFRLASRLVPASAACAVIREGGDERELRGAEAHTLLKAWNTGNPGGMATVHANEAVSDLTRLETLVR